jgi:acetylglutamate kinase
MRLVIKVGGTLLDDDSACRSIASQLADVAARHELMVVHGGGKQVTRFLDERSIPTHFVDGLRVSDEPVIDAVTKVIAGSVNKRLVSAIIAAGQPAVGLSGVDGPLTVAEPLDPALGFVGKPVHTEKRLLDLLVAGGFLPVIACVAGDRSGNIYNVNADQMAVSCALGWQAEQLLFLTDVAGVQDHTGRVLPHIMPEDVRRLIDSGVAHGGMQAKLAAAAAALAAGIAEVVVAPGAEAGICQRILAGETVGTRLLSASLPRSVVNA